MFNTVKKKVVSLSRLKIILRPQRALGKTIVFTNGCFDIIHAGHVRYLNKSKSLGDILLVGLNSDKSVKGIKGGKTAAVSAAGGAGAIASSDAGELVGLFNESTPIG